MTTLLAHGTRRHSLDATPGATICRPLTTDSGYAIIGRHREDLSKNPMVTQQEGERLSSVTPESGLGALLGAVPEHPLRCHAAPTCRFRRGIKVPMQSVTPAAHRPFTIHHPTGGSSVPPRAMPPTSKNPHAAALQTGPSYLKLISPPMLPSLFWMVSCSFRILVS